jgi:DNA-binding NtrC family response regulator
VEKASNNRVRTVLLVDDDVDTRQLSEILLNTIGYEVHAATNPREALNFFNPKVHALVLTDNNMPGMTGADMAQIIKTRSPSTPVVMYSGNPPNNCPSVDVVIKKPSNLVAIKTAVESLLTPDA